MATHIIGAYEFASKFALDNGISEHKVTTIYNRVYLDFINQQNLENLQKN